MVYSKIMLGGKRGRGQYALVSPCDAYYLSQFKWHFQSHHSGDGYVSRWAWSNGKRTKFLLHREVMGHPKNLCVHHINGDGLDNRRENLCVCTLSHNQRNRVRKNVGVSKFIGVRRSETAGRWRATTKIGFGRRTVSLGTFDTEEEASNAYQKHRNKHLNSKEDS